MNDVTTGGRVLAPGRYDFSAVEVGDRIETGSVDVTKAKIDAFAALTGDYFALHMDDDAARALGFSGRVAHGLLVLSLIDGLKNQAPAQFEAVASLGWDWRFSGPVLVGDVVRAKIKVVEKRGTSRADRGILTLEMVASNQRDAVVQQGVNRLMVCR